MSQKLDIPVFATEAEEADWWYDHRELVEDEFHAAFAEGRVKQGVPLPPSERMVQTTIRLDANDSKKAHAIAAKRGLQYETYLEMLVHQELEQTTEAVESLDRNAA
jgi:predicted DNA binding CopG/RHH family protein